MLTMQIAACVLMGVWSFGDGALVAGCVAFAMAGRLVRFLVTGWGRRYTVAELRDYELTCLLVVVVIVLALLRV